MRHTDTGRVIGITGGVGTGKSTVVRTLEKSFHARVIIADELGHIAMEPGTPENNKIRMLFGDGIMLPDGGVDRAELARQIYADDEKREQLNAIIHPFVFEKIKKLICEWKGEPLIVLETAIMFETGCDALCDEIWAVMADKETRIRRLMDSRGYTREKCEQIMEKQLPDNEWYKKCHKVIDNNGDEKKMFIQLQELLGIKEKM